MAIAGVKVEICKALGLEQSDVFALTIDLAVGSAAAVRIWRYLTKDEDKAVAEVLEHYKLVPKDPEDKMPPRQHDPLL